jgi:molybdopterin/thiamine biosynthesis adenylyltransferase
MSYSTALTTDTDRTLRSHLLRRDGQEDLCFALYHPSQGHQRESALIATPVLPEPGERRVHGNASFSSQYFLRAADLAADTGAGLVLVHSHPGGRGCQDISPDDLDAERGYAAQALALTDRPLAGMTLAGDGAWSARTWTRRGRADYARGDHATVRVIGERLTLTHHPRLSPAPDPNTALQRRTISAWGPDTQAELARLRIGIVGAGSVGALVAEALARTGIRHLVLLDFDSVKRHNLDRLLHATIRDVRLARSKVETLQRALQRSATARDPLIEAHEISIVESDGFARALDCDLLFSCVDRPWARYALNLIAYAHLIPVVDGGIRVTTAAGRRLTGADWRAHVAAPTRQCLECLGQYDPGLVASEREGLLDDPKYIEGLPDDHPIRANQNVFAFSQAAAALEVLQMLSMVIAPSGVGDAGAQHYHFVTGHLDTDSHACAPTCPFCTNLLALGDTASIPVTGRHLAAERERERRAARQRRLPVRLARTLDRARDRR